MNLSAIIVALAFANASAGGYGRGYGYGRAEIAVGYNGNPYYRRVANPGYPGRRKRDAAPDYGYDAMANTRYGGYAYAGVPVAIKAAPAPGWGRRKRNATPGLGYDAMEEVPCVGYAGGVCLYAGYGGAHQIGKRAAADVLYAGLGRAHQIGKRAAAPRYGYDAMADTIYAGYGGAPAIAPAPIPAAYHVLRKRAAAQVYAKPYAELTPEAAPARGYYWGRRKRDAPVADESIAPAYAYAYAAPAYAYAYAAPGYP